MGVCRMGICRMGICRMGICRLTEAIHAGFGGWNHQIRPIHFRICSFFIVHSGEFWNCPENGKLSGKFWRVVKQSGKWEMTLKNLESFETVRKMGYDLEKSGQFWHPSKNGKWSGKIRTVSTPSGKWKIIWKNMDSGELSKIWEIIQKNLESFETV